MTPTWFAYVLAGATAVLALRHGTWFWRLSHQAPDAHAPDKPVTYVSCSCCGGRIYGDSVVLLDEDGGVAGVWCRKC